MTRWEYNTATRTLLMNHVWAWEEEQLRGMTTFQALDALGRDGWELVSAVPIADQSQTVSVEYAFKKPLS